MYTRGYVYVDKYTSELQMAMAFAWERKDEERKGVVAGKAARGGDEWPEKMFEKVVTPSDVGKLNRLVVPKHFAERYFPAEAARDDPAGTVLCFEDARGVGGAATTTWRFRYSYWRSSQSYVMTRGWSRFVRDKRLAAGDTVSFCRAGARLFIDWRRRGSATPAATILLPLPQPGSCFKQARRLLAPPVDDVQAERRRCIRLFGVDVVLRAELPPPPLDLQL